MQLYQLPVSIALLALAVFSALLLIVTRSKEGKIKLPEEDDDEGTSVHDPFDITTPEDLVDGEPVGALRFWKRVWFHCMLAIGC